jgi:hypothetical protein
MTSLARDLDLIRYREKNEKARHGPLVIVCFGERADEALRERQVAHYRLTVTTPVEFYAVETLSQIETYLGAIRARPARIEGELDDRRRHFARHWRWLFHQP